MRYCGRWVSGVIVVLGLLFSGSARAETPPDLVMKKDGTVMRGTISEAIPDKYVEIVLPTGATRRIEASEVTYAGPADKAPGADSGGVVSGTAPDSNESPRVQVTIETDEPELAVHTEAARASFIAIGQAGAVAVVASSFAKVCDAPCTAQAEPGTYRLGLSRKDGPIALSEQIRIGNEPSEIHGKYVSKGGTRTAGWIVMLASIGAGGYLMYDAFGEREDCYDSTPQSCSMTPELSMTKFLLGMGVLLGGSATGVVLIATPDRSEFTVRSVGPRTTARRLPPPRTGAAPIGLSVSARF